MEELIKSISFNGQLNPTAQSQGTEHGTRLDSAALQSAPGPQWALGGVSPF